MDTEIDEIYQELNRVAPSDRLLTKGEKSFFSRKKETIKRKNLRTKKKWVMDAHDILKVYQKRTQGGRAMRDFILYHLRDPG